MESIHPVFGKKGATGLDVKDVTVYRAVEEQPQKLRGKLSLSLR